MSQPVLFVGGDVMRVGGGGLSADWTEVNDTSAVGICPDIDHHNQYSGWGGGGVYANCMQ